MLIRVQSKSAPLWPKGGIRENQHDQYRHQCYDSPVATRGMPAVNTLLDRISIDPDTSGGKPCINGTRIRVTFILDFLADAMTEAEW